MTDIMKLAEEHAVACSRLGDHYVHTRAALQSAIDALQGEVERLKAYAAHERSLAAEKYTQTIHDQKQEIASLQASLMALEKQEPVGFVQHLNELNDKWLQKLPIGAPVYAAPKALEPSACSDFAKEYLSAWDDGMAGDSYLRRMAEAALKCDGITKGTP